MGSPGADDEIVSNRGILRMAKADERDAREQSPVFRWYQDAAVVSLRNPDDG